MKLLDASIFLAGAALSYVGANLACFWLVTAALKAVRPF